MSTQTDTYQLTLESANTQLLANLCGPFNEHLHQIEERLSVEIRHRGNAFELIGDSKKVKVTSKILNNLYQEASKGKQLSPEYIHLFLQESGIDQMQNEKQGDNATASIQTPRNKINPRGENQQNYIKNIQQFDINFGIGPAGTGKTYLAVACAIQALEQEKVRRILLVRPAVEAGEKLGFLPGDLSQKVNPYLRPLYDALYEMLGFDRVEKYIEQNIIEIAPLAYMRGRTLNHAFIILDESQNTTLEQMKMFLTRIGFGSTVVVTGDITQIDLPRDSKSGLTHVIKVLDGVEDIGFTYFTAKDVVRHPLVQQVIEAYERHEKKNKKPDSEEC